MFIFFNLSQEWFDIITIIIIIIIKKSVQNWLYPRIWNILTQIFIVNYPTNASDISRVNTCEIKKKKKKKQEYGN